MLTLHVSLLQNTYICKILKAVLNNFPKLNRLYHHNPSVLQVVKQVIAVRN